MHHSLASLGFPFNNRNNKSSVKDSQWPTIFELAHYLFSSGFGGQLWQHLMILSVSHGSVVHWHWFRKYANVSIEWCVGGMPLWPHIDYIKRRQFSMLDIFDEASLGDDILLADLVAAWPTAQTWGGTKQTRSNKLGWFIAPMPKALSSRHHPT
jgi:hypothetical protein